MKRSTARNPVVAQASILWGDRASCRSSQQKQRASCPLALQPGWLCYWKTGSPSSHL